MRGLFHVRRTLCPGRGARVHTLFARLSIDEIKEKYGLTRVIKLASNENPWASRPW
jgi:hypothetical protein